MEENIQYRKAKTWQIALSQMNSANAMCFYILMTYVSYVGNTGYGIATALIGTILTVSRIIEGVLNPVIAVFVDKFNTRFGKIRIFLFGGWVIQTVATILLFVWGSGKGHGVVLFVVLYFLYLFGYAMNNVAGQIMGPVMTNDPKQRPMVGVWATVYSYFAPMIMTMLITMVILPKYGNTYSVEMLRTSSIVTIAISLVFIILSCIGVSETDKPENFGSTDSSKKEKVSFKDMVSLLGKNKAMQSYVLSASTVKLANQVGSQSIVSTMMFGILIGNMQLSTLISVIAMLPSIVFAIIGGKYAGTHGSRKAISFWSFISLIVTVLMAAFLLLTNTRNITVAILPTIIYFVLTLAVNGTKMGVTAATASMSADVVDYERDRSGKFIPAVVTATYSLIDRLVSSLATLITMGCVALIGYQSTMPQPNDPMTNGIKLLTIFLLYGFPIIGWIVSIAAMKFSPLTKEKMAEIQAKNHRNEEAK